MKHSPYLSAVLTDTATHSACIQGILRELVRFDEGEGFDAIACTGTSGLLVGPTIAYLMNKRLAVVRKEQDMKDNNSHANTVIEHNLEDGDRVVIVDDLIASGRTIMRVADELEKLGRLPEPSEENNWYTPTRTRVEVVAYYLYRDHRLQKGKF